MIVAHVGGVPLEETVLQLAPAGAAIVTAAGIVVHAKLRGLRERLRRRARAPAG